MVTQSANSRLDYLVIHARHGQQRSRDPPVWEAIGRAKQCANIPIIGNGNVVTSADVQVSAQWEQFRTLNPKPVGNVYGTDFRDDEWFG